MYLCVKPLYKHIIMLFVFLTGFMNTGLADEPYCTNIGFELHNFTNWRAYTWADGQSGYVTSTPKVEGIVNGRHTIITSNGYDPIVGGTQLKLIPDGYSTSVKLGSTSLGNGGLRQSLTYQLDVTPQNAFIVYNFAVVLQDPHDSSHFPEDEPRFKVSILDKDGNEITGEASCANYDVNASNANVEGWNTIQYDGKPLYWRDWTTVGINLTKYIGQTVTLEFMSANCRRKGHFGYAYLTAHCQPLYITVDYCADDKIATLTAPIGFKSYQWKDSLNNPVFTGQTLQLSSNVISEGDTYTCEMQSATGCDATLSATIFRYSPNADFTHSQVDCNKVNNTIIFSITSPSTHGTLDYHWDFGDGSTTTDQNPIHDFHSVSGMIPVTLVVKNPPSTCTDSVTKMVETFFPPLIGIDGDSTYCPGETTLLKAHGAHHYEWFDGSTADNITVGKDTEVWMIGYSSNNCHTDTIRVNVKQEPDWVFITSGSELFCSGGSTVLSASGAATYSWSTGETSDSIRVDKPGSYTVTGKNRRGCEKQFTFTVNEDPLPDAGFNMSVNKIDLHNNELSCSVTAQNGVNYHWDMGDGKTEQGTRITHKYDVDPNLTNYKITLTAVNANGCRNSASKMVNVVLFIPNVFTPNGDGINDKFMDGKEIIIYDRNGNILYKGDNGWDGNYKGEKADNDTYFYYIKYIDTDGSEKTAKGFIQLKR